MTRMRPVLWTLGVVLAALAAAPRAQPAFDHSYAEYAALLEAFVQPPRVDYRALQAERGRLDRVVASFAAPGAAAERGWTRDQRMAFWINAYNLFTLKAIVDHYPIASGWLTLGPRNSIRQIDGVWTTLTWKAAGRAVTLDDIEHRILRPEFKDARVHFALTCASISCPPLASAPYQAARLGAQLDAAGRAYMSSPEGLRASGTTLRVSSIFKWYGDDFIDVYAPKVPGTRAARERAILGVISTFGPAAAAERARAGDARIRFLTYNWALNDVPR